MLLQPAAVVAVQLVPEASACNLDRPAVSAIAEMTGNPSASLYEGSRKPGPVEGPS